MHHHVHVKGKPQKRLQSGFSILELMVAMGVGLLVIATAVGGLLISRHISGTVSDATHLQQQAGYIFRVIGRQVRQAGSIELSLDPKLISGTETGLAPELQPVAFDPPDNTHEGFNRDEDTISADANSFTVSQQGYKEQTTNPKDSMMRDCLGSDGKLSEISNPSPIILSSQFKINNKNELTCKGTDASAGSQAIASNVVDFQLVYLYQEENSLDVQMSYRKYDEVEKWENVYAVEVCIEMEGNEHVDTADEIFTNCSGEKVSYNNKLKKIFKKIYYFRTQGKMRGL